MILSPSAWLLRPVSGWRASQPLPCGEENLAYRAANSFSSAYGMEAGVEIELEKRIHGRRRYGGRQCECRGCPAGAEPAGRQAVFRWHSCREIGLALGADVPFCLQGGCVLAQGIGEVLTDLGTPPQVYYVIAKPRVSVSTKWVYTHLDHTAGIRPDCAYRRLQKVSAGAIWR